MERRPLGGKGCSGINKTSDLKLTYEILTISRQVSTKNFYCSNLPPRGRCSGFASFSSASNVPEFLRLDFSNFL